MSRRVVLQRLATNDLVAAYRWAAAKMPDAAARWLIRFESALETLADNPERCPFARENGKVGIEVREHLFGKRPHVFRVIFTIEDESVRVLRILRAQRRFLTREQLEQAAEADDAD
ncbi:MAG: type II toxin-antitoxin system RelE/ParE family toxin [Planctomycetota bacterium]|nr:type II toxin-antitoxin system RelE/ParE family toxin [Planctomycetaceae bacterium]MDQ3331029.1 type II toxin-antitoxin system RelE/ParE family toxin [Planctomycetota bacterium]